jgi:2-polyprenyl-3-methyl-5-hydroxy-6-metoxy-1,4-benzoquinol methylase
MKPWYEALFENYARKYESECFVQGTPGECDFIVREIGADKSRRILDIGCGTGRHAIELARRGYTVVGVDLSDSQLARARQNAAEQTVQVDFRQGDARQLPFQAEFDLAIMLCEGAFPLMETDEMNFHILQGAARALRPGGKLVFTTLNGLFPLFHSVKDFLAKAAAEGNAQTTASSFDLMTFRDRNTTVFEDDDGNRKELACNERYYVPSEITWLLKTAGFRAPEIFGAKLGAYSRADALTPDDFEMLVIAEKA